MVHLRGWAPLLAGPALVAAAAAARMDCGDGVPLCGSLALESGFGPGVYHHATPHVHGLWPAVGEYGNSKCVPPKDSADPTNMYPCYTQDNQTEEHQRWFESHEWDKHGRCAGVTDADDFFHQVCNLSSAPVAAMTGAGSFELMVQALKSHGYAIWSLDKENDQIELSACAGPDGRWKLANTSDFSSKCGGGAPPSPGPAPPAPAGECVRGRHGPPCQQDADCAHVEGCVRCAHSGYCTDVPIGDYVGALEVDVEVIV